MYTGEISVLANILLKHLLKINFALSNLKILLISIFKETHIIIVVCVQNYKKQKFGKQPTLAFNTFLLGTLTLTF